MTSAFSPKNSAADKTSSHFISGRSPPRKPRAASAVSPKLETSPSSPQLDSLDDADFVLVAEGDQYYDEICRSLVNEGDQQGDDRAGPSRRAPSGSSRKRASHGEPKDGVVGQGNAPSEERLQCSNPSCCNPLGRWHPWQHYSGSTATGQTRVFKTCVHCRNVDAEKKRKRRKKQDELLESKEREIARLKGELNLLRAAHNEALKALVPGSAEQAGFLAYRAKLEADRGASS